MLAQSAARRLRQGELVPGRLAARLQRLDWHLGLAGQSLGFRLRVVTATGHPRWQEPRLGTGALNGGKTRQGPAAHSLRVIGIAGYNGRSALTAGHGHGRPMKGETEMECVMKRFSWVAALCLLVPGVLWQGSTTSAAGGDVLVNVGSPPTTFSQN